MADSSLPTATSAGWTLSSEGWGTDRVGGRAEGVGSELCLGEGERMEGVEEEVSHAPPCVVFTGEKEGVLRVTGSMREEEEEGGFGGPIGEDLTPTGATLEFVA